ncbi:MAG: flagellin [Pacificimonas sp.]
MSLSVNTNSAALNALQMLSQSTRQLDETQLRVNSGLKVRSAADNAAVFAIAQNMRAEHRGLEAVMDSLNRSQSVLDVTMAATESVQDILIQMRAKAVAAADAGLDENSREALRRDFESLRDQMQVMVGNASFNGSNIIDGADGEGLTAIVAPDASLTITVPRVNLQLAADGTSTFSPPVQDEDGTFSGDFIHLAMDSSFDDAPEARALIAAIDVSIKNLSQGLTVFGAASKTIETQQTFAVRLGDAIEKGIGQLVDADIARESARLQALQVKQQLGIQALQIANSQSQSILSLFGG